MYYIYVCIHYAFYSIYSINIYKSYNIYCLYSISVRIIVLGGIGLLTKQKKNKTKKFHKLQW